MKKTAIIQENPDYVRVNGAIINRNKKDYELALLRNKDKNRINIIENKVNGHKYVGSAINLTKRWNNHRDDLQRNNHHSSHLQTQTHTLKVNKGKGG